MELPTTTSTIERRIILTFRTNCIKKLGFVIQFLRMPFEYYMTNNNRRLIEPKGKTNVSK